MIAKAIVTRRSRASLDEGSAACLEAAAAGCLDCLAREDLHAHSQSGETLVVRQALDIALVDLLGDDRRLTMRSNNRRAFPKYRAPRGEHIRRLTRRD